MKHKYKLKGWVVSSLYLFSISLLVITGVIVTKSLNGSIYSSDTLSYVYKDLIKDKSLPVNVTSNTSIINPYDNEEVKVIKDYYDSNSEEAVQENSLIFYQNTYMPNTGVLYGNSAEFDVLSVLDGTIENIVADEILGNIVTIKHTNNLYTLYECLNEVKVSIGDEVKQGDVLGNSGSNKIESSSDNMLLFEVIYNGEYLNPNTFLQMNLSELN